MPIKINGATSGSTTITAPDTGSDESIELSTALASKLDLAGGRIVQVVRGTDISDRSTSSTSLVDANISVTITPEIATSAIILIWSAAVRHPSGGFISLAITDSSNNAVFGAQSGSTGSATATTDPLNYVTLVGYSTPATTSATTYKGRFNVSTGAGTIFNATISSGQLFAIEVSA